MRLTSKIPLAKIRKRDEYFYRRRPVGVTVETAITMGNTIKTKKYQTVKPKAIKNNIFFIFFYSFFERTIPELTLSHKSKNRHPSDDGGGFCFSLCGYGESNSGMHFGRVPFYH